MTDTHCAIVTLKPTSRKTEQPRRESIGPWLRSLLPTSRKTDHPRRESAGTRLSSLLQSTRLIVWSVCIDRMQFNWSFEPTSRKTEQPRRESIGTWLRSLLQSPRLIVWSVRIEFNSIGLSNQFPVKPTNPSGSRFGIGF